jgi:aminoglycoside phosphotransferase (APT) family kinase protein
MVDGLDLGALEEFLRSSGAVRDPGDRPYGELHAQLIAGGKSNLTYRVTDGVHDWVVRRPPLGHVLATAHDMAREHRVMSALSATTVPVPEMVALCEDPTVMGVPFYVMHFVEGAVLRRTTQSADLSHEQRADIAHRLVDTLADLHEVDPDTVGLSDFGHPAGFLERQVRRWTAQLERSRTREVPGFPELASALAARVPQSQRASIVHGDYRLDNVLIGQDQRIRAVLDWEMATLGDPLTDLALMLVYGRLGESGLDSVTNVSLAPGFLTEAEIIERYSRGSDRDLSDFGFYLGLAAFKLAAILEGIHYRFLNGQTVGPGFDRIGEAIHPLLAAGLTAIKEN